MSLGTASHPLIEDTGLQVLPLSASRGINCYALVLWESVFAPSLVMRAGTGGRWMTMGFRSIELRLNVRNTHVNWKILMSKGKDVLWLTLKKLETVLYTTGLAWSRQGRMLELCYTEFLRNAWFMEESIVGYFPRWKTVCASMIYPFKSNASNLYFK